MPVVLLWKDGYYKLDNKVKSPIDRQILFKVSGETVHVALVGNDEQFLTHQTWMLGDFGRANKKITNITGITNYNIEIKWTSRLWGMEIPPTHGIVHNDGKSIGIPFPFPKQKPILYPILLNQTWSLKWMSEEDYSFYINSFDPANAPPNHYKIQPGFQGQFLWISGSPGTGKSTTGQLLSKKEGYVYYEGDAFYQFANPYLPPDVTEPSLAVSKQKSLKGLPKETLKEVIDGELELTFLYDGKKYNKTKVEMFYTSMCDNIIKERKRLGGNWVVARTVPTRDLRDHIKHQCGSHMYFIVLGMTKEHQRQRIVNRHRNNTNLIKIYTGRNEVFEKAGEDEDRAINILVTNNMSREDVLQKIMKLKSNAIVK